MTKAAKADYQRRYKQTAAGKATLQRFLAAERVRNAHVCARPGCGNIVVGKKIGRRRQLCRPCVAAIRTAMLWGDDFGRTLPGLGTGGE